MKRFSISTPSLAQALMITLIISACGTAPQAAPTVNPVDLQVTAVAAAYTIVAETQAAIPTSTPLPSPTATLTNTPNATTTLPPLPTLGATFTPSPVGSGPVDPCINTVLPDSLTGNTIKIRIDNPTKATIMLSVNLQKSSPQGVCGYRGYTLTARQSLVITDLVEGCYTLWAWNPDPNEYFMVTNGTSCLNNSNSWTFDILPNDSIKLRE